jgi:hypothetical protein
MPVTINGTTGIAGANGSASTPAVQGEDTNTGVFFPAADTVAVATGGSERMRVDSSGNVGVGTTSPQAYTNYTVLTVDNATNGGVVSVRKNGSALLNMYTATGYGVVEGVGGGTGLLFNTGDAERFRITSSGYMLANTAGLTGTPGVITSNGVIGVAYSFRSHVADTGPNGHIAFTNPNGTVGQISTNGSATIYSTSSDYRLKENVQPMQDALAVIAQLNPVTYTWKADGSDGQGFIAHELQAVVPDCVTGEKDAVDAEGNPQYQGVDTSFLVATLVKAVQELKAEVDSLKAQLEAN